VAGTDTTSYFLMTMIYLILKNPQVEHKLRQEIETHMSDDDYSYANLKNMVYIDYIQK
jgi:cytochrome P450